MASQFRIPMIHQFTKPTQPTVIASIIKLNKFCSLALMNIPGKRGFSNDRKTVKNKVIIPKRIEDARIKRPSFPNQISQNVARVGTPNQEQDYMPDEVDELDYVAHSITTYGSKHSAFKAEMEKTKDLLKLNSFVRAKTLGNKHFKTVKSPNLLTWACKEQIRFLHETDPELWSVQELAEKFPVSEFSVRKIIKSRVRLHRLVDIKEHDLFVKQNWEKFLNSLLSNSYNPSNNDEFIRDILSNIGSKENLYNTFPLESDLNSRQVSVMQRTRKLGVFSSLVKDEIEKKEFKHHILCKNHQEDLDELKNILGKIKQILTESEVDFKSSVEKDKQSKFEENLGKRKLSSEVNGTHFIRIASSNSEEKASVYPRVVDGCVYDENGDFLYRIP